MISFIYGSSKNSKTSSLRERNDRSNLNEMTTNKEIASVVKNDFAMTVWIFRTAHIAKTLLIEVYFQKKE